MRPPGTWWRSRASRRHAHPRHLPLAPPRQCRARTAQPGLVALDLEPPVTGSDGRHRNARCAGQLEAEARDVAALQHAGRSRRRLSRHHALTGFVTSISLGAKPADSSRSSAARLLRGGARSPPRGSTVSSSRVVVLGAHSSVSTPPISRLSSCRRRDLRSPLTAAYAGIRPDSLTGARRRLPAPRSWPIGHVPRAAARVPRRFRLRIPARSPTPRSSPSAGAVRAVRGSCRRLATPRARAQRVPRRGSRRDAVFSRMSAARGLVGYEDRSARARCVCDRGAFATARAPRGSGTGCEVARVPRPASTGVSAGAHHRQHAHLLLQTSSCQDLPRLRPRSVAREIAVRRPLELLFRSVAVVEASSRRGLSRSAEDLVWHGALPATAPAHLWDRKACGAASRR